MAAFVDGDLAEDLTLVAALAAFLTRDFADGFAVVFTEVFTVVFVADEVAVFLAVTLGVAVLDFAMGTFALLRSEETVLVDVICQRSIGDVEKIQHLEKMSCQNGKFRSVNRVGLDKQSADDDCAGWRRWLGDVLGPNWVGNAP